MTTYIFLYNVVAIKSDLFNLIKERDTRFILIGSEYCLQRLSLENRLFFDEIYSVNRNFHQIDAERVEKVLLKILETEPPEKIQLLTNEDSTQLVCAMLREKYKIPGNNREQVLPFVNKVISKNKLLGKVRVPRFMPFNKAEYHINNEDYLALIIEKIGFPIFIKPIDLVSSIGTYYVPDLKTLQHVLSIISKEPWNFEIDEFIEGDLFHCDSIVHNNEIEFFMAGKYAWPLAQFSKGSPMGSIPVHNECLFAELKQFNDLVLSHLGTFPSAFHMEVFKDNKSGDLVFLEIAARTPGALVPDMYEKIFSEHLENLHYRVQLQPECDLKIARNEYSAGWITFPKIEGVIEDIKRPKIPIDNIFTNFVKLGEKLNQAQSLLDSSCSVVFWDESYQQVEKVFEFLRHYQPLILAEPAMQEGIKL